jgi:hypothetical protein
MGLVTNIDELVSIKKKADKKRLEKDKEEAEQLQEIGSKVKKKLKNVIF